ncbi:methylglyoxal synthase-like [Oratosquilla oratoria]|uniref:methylglyoxal synthase-like n=1 Tax=Oratosquilla oratoria TaxID=337810 RepID=UPI003F758755
MKLSSSELDLRRSPLSIFLPKKSYQFGSVEKLPVTPSKFRTTRSPERVKKNNSSTMRMLPARKRIALVAHDKRKGKLLQWTQKWREVLQGHDLLGTGTTSMWLRDQVGLEVEGLLSGPFGGDQQIGARIAEQRLDMLVFFWDPFDVMPHDSDVKALLRIATLYDVPIANNPITADFLITSPLMDQKVLCHLPDTKEWLASRKPTSSNKHNPQG